MAQPVQPVPQVPNGVDGTNGTNGIDGSTGATGATGGGGGATGPTGPSGNDGANGSNGATGATGPAGGSLPNGTAAGNTTYWDGTQWVVNNSNIYNNGAGVGINTTTPQSQLDVNGGVSIGAFCRQQMLLL